MKKIQNLILFIAVLALGYDGNSQNTYVPSAPRSGPIPLNSTCDPVVTGPTRMCDQAIVNLTATYTITNFDPTGNYTLVLWPYSFAALNPTSTTTASFTLTFPNTYNQFIIWVEYVDATGTVCGGNVSIVVSACCPNFNDFITNSSSSLSGTTMSAIYVGNEWVVLSQTVLLNGTFTVNDNIKFVNCSLLMSPGAEVIINTGKRLTLSNDCQVQASCNNMWKGITLVNNGEFAIINNTNGMSYQATVIRDAQYAVKINGDAAYYIHKGTRFERNYVDMYFPQIYPSYHHIQPLSINGVNDQSWTMAGTNENYFTGDPWYRPLLPAYSGQNPTPVNNQSFANIWMFDVDQFEFFNKNFNIPTNTVNIGWNQYGIKAKNSNIDIEYFNILSVQPDPNSEVAAGGVGVYAETRSSSLSQRRLLRMRGILHNNAFNSIVGNCRTGVQVVNGMDLDIDQVLFQGWNYLTTPIVNTVSANRHVILGSQNRSLSITNSKFSYSYVGIYSGNITGSALRIDNNLFDQPVPVGWSGTFNNTAMQLYGTTSGVVPVNLTITNNVIQNLRIGLYTQFINGGPARIKSNHYLIDQSMFTPGGTLYNQPHYGYWMDRCTNLNFDANEARNISGLGNTDAYRDNAIAFNIKRSGSGINNGTIAINTSNIVDMGTAFRFVDLCTGVNLKCNGIEHCKRGVFFDYGDINSQGITGTPWGNEWQNWTAAVLNRRVEGNWQTTPLNPVDWYYDQSNPTLQRPFPYNVNPPNNFLDIPTNGTPPCAAPLSGGGEGEGARVYAIIDDELEYNQYPAESRERDKEYAYLVLKNDATLRSSNAVFADYFTDHINSNYEKFDVVNKHIETGDNATAIAELNTITPANDLESNLKFAMNIALQKENDPGYIISPNDEATLIQLAWMPVWQGGNAVFVARALMNQEVNDVGNGLRIAHAMQKGVGINTAVYPNPATAFIYTEVNGIKEYEITITEVTGRVAKNIHATAGKTFIDLKALSNGLYLVSIKNAGNILSQTKISKQ